jgi:HlyD family secretion protein
VAHPTKNPRLVSFGLLAAAFALAGCEPAGSGKAPPATAPAPIAVTLVPVIKGVAIRHVDVTGTLYGDVETTVAAKLSGRIESLRADLGDEVATGELLGSIDRRDYELELAQRESAVLATLAQLGLTALPDGAFDPSAVPAVRRRRSESDNAQAKLTRAERLFNEKPPLIAEQDLADLRTTWAMARDAAEVELLAAKALIAKARSEQSAVDIARQRLDDTSIRVPAGFSGAAAHFRIAERMVAAGEFMTEGRAMFRLVATDPIRFRANVPERFAGAIAVGQSAALWLEGAQEVGAVATSGSVARIAPRIDEKSRSFEVEIVVANPTGRLKPGAFARGSIEIRRDPDVTFVPAAAVVTFAGVDRVFSVKDGKAVAHRVRLGQRQGQEPGTADGAAELIEIVGPLPTDQVVLQGAASLSANAPVTLAASK